MSKDQTDSIDLLSICKMTNLLSLDCESKESALRSVANIYQTTAAAIEGFLRGFDLEAHYRTSRASYGGDHEVKRALESALGIRAQPIQRVCWFHLTRTLPDNNFVDGIKPLSQSLALVWDAIERVFSSTEHADRFAQLRRDGVDEFHYQLKAHEPVHSGPYGMLVREVAFCPSEISNHDYLWLPEIMEDICNGFAAQTGVNLHERLHAALAPKIVKFWCSRFLDESYLGSAIYYLYLTAQNLPLSGLANTCYDGNDQSVPIDQILKVDLVREGANEEV